MLRVRVRLRIRLIEIGLYLTPQTTQLADHVISSPLPEELAKKPLDHFLDQVGSDQCDPPSFSFSHGRDGNVHIWNLDRKEIQDTLKVSDIGFCKCEMICKFQNPD